MGPEENKNIPDPGAGGNPIPDKTLPFEQPPTLPARETVSNRSAAAETEKNKRLDRSPEDSAAAHCSPTAQEGTLQQDERDKKAAIESSAHREAPPVVPGYNVEEKLGQGTYGVVWRATEKTTNKQVAIKFFHKRVGEMWQIVWAEVKQLAMLDAVKGIVQLKDAEPDAAPPYFIMNYAEGGSLASLVKKGTVPVPLALDLFREMVEAMAYVHAKGIRHCDLKPANILLDARNKPLIADFGQAHLSLESQSASVNLGTFYYMAPEQADLDKQIPDTRWDVYGLGAIFYSMLVGEPPRANTGLTGELNNTVHLQTRLQRYQDGVARAPAPVKHRKLPGMDRPLADILERCLHLDPAKRYQNASDILQALEQRERYLRRRPLIYMGLAASLLLLLCLGGLASALVHYSVHDTQAALENQILKDDRTTAQLIANVVGEKVGELKYQVRRLAENEKLNLRMAEFAKEIEAFPPERKRSKDYVSLDSYKELEKQLLLSYRKNLHLLIYYDLDGHLLAGAFPKENPGNGVEEEKRRWELYKIYGKQYHYRDYFHGLGDDQPHDEPQKYIKRLYVSEPYLSTLVEKGRTPILMAVSCPVYPLIDVPGKQRKVSDESQPPIGILVGYIHLEELYSWIEDVHVEHGCAILLNHHGQSVYCSDKKYKNNLLPRAREPLKRFPRDMKNIQERHQEQDEHYIPEVLLPEKVETLATFVSITGEEKHHNGQDENPMWEERDRWGVMVLHYRDEVFQPIQSLRNTLFRVIAVVSGICALLLLAVWVWLLRALRGKEPATA